MCIFLFTKFEISILLNIGVIHKKSKVFFRFTQNNANIGKFEIKGIF